MTYGPGRAELALAPHALGAEASSGVSAALDLADATGLFGVGQRQIALLDLDVTVIGGTSPSLAVTAETSRDGSLWHAAPVGAFDVVTAVGWQRKAFLDLDRYLRFRWAIGGTSSPTVTFALSGVALLVYASLKDIGTLALRTTAIADLLNEEKFDQLVAASDETDLDVGDRYVLPLVTWSGAVSRHTGAIAALIMKSSDGYAPEPNTVDTFAAGHARAKATLRQIFTTGDPGITGQVKPADFSTGGINPPERCWSRGWDTRG